MLTLLELDYFIQQAFSGKVPRDNYFIAALFDKNKVDQLEDAEILNWTDEKHEWPTVADITAWKKKYGPNYTEHKAATDARFKRDALLKEADVLVYKAMDSDDDEKVKAAKAYRQALRNVPQQEGFPTSVVWPELTL